jgi:hypothetical protein
MPTRWIRYRRRRRSAQRGGLEHIALVEPAARPARPRRGRLLVSACTAPPMAPAQMAPGLARRTAAPRIGPPGPRSSGIRARDTSPEPRRSGPARHRHLHPRVPGPPCQARPTSEPGGITFVLTSAPAPPGPGPDPAAIEQDRAHAGQSSSIVAP